MKEYIDISTDEKKESVYNLFCSFSKKKDIYAFYNKCDNKDNIEYINKVAKEIGFDFSFWKQKKEDKFCVLCGKKLINQQKKFCSASCSAKFNNTGRRYSEETKHKISESLRKRSDAKPLSKKKCKFCGRVDCNHEKACSHHSINWLSQLIPFSFNIKTIGTPEVNNEYDRITKLLDEEYNVNNLSVSQIKEKYKYNGTTERLVKVMNRLGIKLRTVTDGLKNAYLKGTATQPNNSNIYKICWHTTWDGKKVFLRSSYELDFAKELDEKKVLYEVESLRIKYWDSQLNTFRCAIPDFYLPEDKIIIEIKSSYTLNKINMKDKFQAYRDLGFKTKLICDHETLDM